MEHKRNFPAKLYFQTKNFHFCFNWTEPAVLHIEAIKKNQPTKCFKGHLRSQQLQKGTTLKSLFQFLQQKSLQSSITKADYLSLIITIIDQTQQDKGYACRIIFQDKIKSIKVEASIVSETYFLAKKIEAMEQEKNNDRIMIAEFGNELTKKLQEKDYDMKRAFSQQMQGMISAVTNRIEKEFQERSKVFNQIAPNVDIEIDSIPNVKKIQKKIRKKIKKEIKEKKKAKKHKQKEKRKKRKQKRKQKKRIKALLQAQQNGQNGLFPDNILIDSNTPPQQILGFPQQQKNNNAVYNFENNLLNVDEMPFNNNEEGIEHSKKKKKKQKHRKEERVDNPTIHTKPQNTSLVSMSKLRTRGGGADLLRPEDPIEIIQEENIQAKPKKQKRSKQKKNKSKQNKNRQLQQIQHIEQQGQRQYHRRLEQLRKVGNIDQVRVTKANRNKPILALPKQPLAEIDEFNPKYNGQPKYKPFVGLNEYHAVRPGQIFAQTLEAVGSECKKIPANFREQIPSFKNFDVNGCVVRKKQGLNYQQMVFDYLLPQTGKHVLTMRLIETKRMYIWFGIIDLRQKDRQQSFNKKNCITFSFRTGHIATSNKWSKGKIGRMQVGLSIRMEIDMDKNSIIWYISDGRNNIAPIPKLMRKLMLVPYFEMMDIGDQICFEQ